MNDALKSALDRATSDPNYGFDTLRDELCALPVEVLPEVVAAAEDAAYSSVKAQIVAALGDLEYPGAYDVFVRCCAEDADPWPAIDAGCALDRAGGGGFGFWERIAPGEQPDPILVTANAPALVEWWNEEGAANAPDLEAWTAARTNVYTPTADERVYAFVRSHPDWVVLSNGMALQTDQPLPKDGGRHIVSGTAKLQVGTELPVALVLDGSLEDPIVAAWAETQRGPWAEVRSLSTELRTPFALGDTSLDDFDSPYEIGPTGSLKTR